MFYLKFHWKSKVTQAFSFHKLCRSTHCKNIYSDGVFLYINNFLNINSVHALVPVILETQRGLYPRDQRGPQATDIFLKQKYFKKSRSHFDLCKYDFLKLNDKFLLIIQMEDSFYLNIARLFLRRLHP